MNEYSMTVGEFRIAPARDIFDIGEWQTYLSPEDITYTKCLGESVSYGHDFIAITRESEVVGYAIALGENLLSPTEYSSGYSRIYDVYDLSIDLEKGEGEKILGALIEYLKERARQKDCDMLVFERKDPSFVTVYRYLKEEVLLRNRNLLS